VRGAFRLRGTLRRTTVAHVFPDVPVRQWVLSLPHRLRYRLAWDHDLCRRVAAVFLRAVFRLLREHARAAGLEQPRVGAVAVIQRFGGALNINVPPSPSLP
jgi:hypothetical protein